MYTKEEFKNEIRKFIADKGYEPTSVGDKAYQLYVCHANEIDDELRTSLLDVANMEMGPEFEMNSKEFEDFLKNI